MNELSDYPLAPFVNALRTVVGRVTLAFSAVALGAYLGGLTSTYSWSDAFAGISEFHHLVVVSILFIGIGLFALPATLLFIIMFTRSEWPLWTVTVATLLIWWNTHKTIYWTLHESAAAQIQKIADDANQQLAKEVEEERKKNQAEAAK